tara:strand:- start:322 stop:438 length:117 start_codon:yes stop_codon:yes gene_type:complete
MLSGLRTEIKLSITHLDKTPHYTLKFFRESRIEEEYQC